MLKRSRLTKDPSKDSRSSRLGVHFRLVTMATSVSRVTGYVRDTLNAALFGAGWISDAYFMAIRIPTLLRDLFAEGALSNAFIPALSARLEKKEDRSAWELMSQVFTLLLLVTGGLSVLGILFASPIVALIAHGFTDEVEKFRLTVELTRILFPVLLFVSMAALWMGALNSLHRFTAPAFAPVFMNLVQVIVGVYLLLYCEAQNPEGELRNVRIWAVSMTVGMLLQWLVQIPAALRAGAKVRWAWPPVHPGVKQMLRLMGPAVVSQSVLQVNLLVNLFFASFLATGCVSYFYFGSRLFQLPFGVLGVSIATVTFPLLSRLASAGNMRDYSQTLTRALNAALFFMLPCTIGIWIVAKPACQLAFEYGRFTPEATQATAEVTAIYALGLLGYTGVKILQQAYYARGNAHMPFHASLVSMGTNVILNLSAFLFVSDPKLRFWGLAFASSASSFVNLFLLLSGLYKLGARMSFAGLAKEAVKVVSASLAMGLVAWASLRGIEGVSLPGQRLWDFMLPVAAGALVYFVLARWMGLQGFGWVMSRWRKK